MERNMIKITQLQQSAMAVFWHHFHYSKLRSAQRSFYWDNIYSAVKSPSPSTVNRFLDHMFNERTEGGKWSEEARMYISIVELLLHLAELSCSISLQTTWENNGVSPVVTLGWESIQFTNQSNSPICHNFYMYAQYPSHLQFQLPKLDHPLPSLAPKLDQNCTSELA